MKPLAQTFVLIVALFSITLGIKAQSSRTTASGTTTTATERRQTTDTTAVCRALRDTLRARQRVIVDTYNQLMRSQGSISGVPLLAMRSDVYQYTDNHRPAALTERAESDATLYADSLLAIVANGNFDELMAISSNYLQHYYDSLLHKKCGKAYERAGMFDPTSPNLNKDQRKVVKQKAKLLPYLRTDLQKEMGWRLPDLKAERRAQRIDALRHSPVVYPAFDAVISELRDSMNVWLTLSYKQLIAGRVERCINPWFNRYFPRFTKECTGPVKIPAIQNTQVVQTTSSSARIYAPSEVAQKAYYGTSNFNTLSIDIQTSLRKPQAVRSGRVRGTVVVRVVVDTDGSLSSVKLHRHFNNRECNNEAIRVIKSLPRRFYPARDARGNAVRQYMDIEVVFRR